MPQCELNFEGSEAGSHHNACKADGQIRGESLVNGPVGLHAGRTIENSKVGSLDPPKPPCLMNGYVHHGDQNRRASPPKNKRRQNSTFSPVGNASAAGWVKNVEVLDAIATNGVDVHLCENSEQEPPDPRASASKKNRRRKNRSKLKRKEVTSSEGAAPPSMPQEEDWEQKDWEQKDWEQKDWEQKDWEQENWEQEIQETKIKNWEELCFGLNPYGSEDVIHFELRGLPLPPESTMALSGMDSFCPAKRHVHPIQWTCYVPPYEPGQFSDAE